jgi:hypothetical protein
MLSSATYVKLSVHARCFLEVYHSLLLLLLLFSLALQPSAGFGLPVSPGFLITHNDTLRSEGLLSTSDQFVADTPDNIQHTQQTNIHAHGGIRNYDRTRRAAADLRLRPRGHWDRHIPIYC